MQENHCKPQKNHLYIPIDGYPQKFYLSISIKSLKVSLGMLPV